jgi:hypothetical protein
MSGMTTKITQEHVRIAAMCSREGWDVPAEFVAESERLTGIPFLKMTAEDLERADRLKQYEMLAADAAAEAELRLIGQALVANGQATQAEYEQLMAESNARCETILQQTDLAVQLTETARGGVR